MAVKFYKQLKIPKHPQTKFGPGTWAVKDREQGSTTVRPHYFAARFRAPNRRRSRLLGISLCPSHARLLRSRRTRALSPHCRVFSTSDGCTPLPVSQKARQAGPILFHSVRQPSRFAFYFSRDRTGVPDANEAHGSDKRYAFRSSIAR